ncbi:MAG: hypothetical protein AAF337_06890 [Pseudomonadota bacterium]
MCNRSQNVIEYAILENNWLTLRNKDWKIEGWFGMPPGVCNAVAISTKRKEVYLSVRSITPNGPVLMPFEVKPSKTIHKLGSEATDLAFCVKTPTSSRKRSFIKTLKTLEAHTQCQDGWYLQIFNIFAFAYNKGKYTIDLE